MSHDEITGLGYRDVVEVNLLVQRLGSGLLSYRTPEPVKVLNLVLCLLLDVILVRVSQNVTVVPFLVCTVTLDVMSGCLLVSRRFVSIIYPRY